MLQKESNFINLKCDLITKSHRLVIASKWYKNVSEWMETMPSSTSEMRRQSKIDLEYDTDNVPVSHCMSYCFIEVYSWSTIQKMLTIRTHHATGNFLEGDSVHKMSFKMPDITVDVSYLCRSVLFHYDESNRYSHDTVHMPQNIQKKLDAGAMYIPCKYTW